MCFFLCHVFDTPPPPFHPLEHIPSPFIRLLGSLGSRTPELLVILFVLEVELATDGGRDALVLHLLKRAFVALVSLAEDVFLESIDG